MAHKSGQKSQHVQDHVLRQGTGAIWCRDRSSWYSKQKPCHVARHWSTPHGRQQTPLAHQAREMREDAKGARTKLAAHQQGSRRNLHQRHAANPLSPREKGEDCGSKFTSMQGDVPGEPSHKCVAPWPTQTCKAPQVDTKGKGRGDEKEPRTRPHAGGQRVRWRFVLACLPCAP